MTTHNLTADAVTPKDVLEDVTAKLDEIDQLFVVAIKGKRSKTWASGSLDGLPRAAMLLNLRAMEVLREEMAE